ncbi:MAG: MMPL family transporter [Acidobacteriota bacterium]
MNSHKRGVLQRLLVGIGRVSVKHPRTVLLAVILVTIVAGYFATRLQFQSRIEDFLPQDSPVVRAFQKAMDRYGTTDYLIIAIEGMGEEDADIRENLADAIYQKLQGEEEIKFIDYRIREELQDFIQKNFFKYALLYLDREGLERLKEKLSDEEIQRQVEENRRILLSPASIIVKEAINYDFLNLRSLYFGKIDLGRGKLKISFHDGYYFSSDMTMLLMLVKPVKPPQDIAFCRVIVNKVKKAISEAGIELKEEEEEDIPGISVGLTGGYLISLAYDGLLKKDMILTILTSFLGVMALFLFTFRRILSPIYAGIPLIVGLIWTMGFTYFTIGSINFFTGASAAVLMGLGIDFCIHLYNRYLEEMHLKRSLIPAFDNTMSETGVGIFSAMMTTAVAFYAALFSDFKGLFQLGLICGSGMIICFLATFLILPALISIGIRVKWVRDRRRGMTTFGLERISKRIIKHYRAIIIACIGITIICLVMMFKLRIEEDFMSLRPKGIAAIELQERIVEKIGSAMVSTMIVAESDSEEGILQLSARIASRLEKLVRNGEVISFRSISMILPPIDEQKRNISWLKEEKKKDPAAFDISRIRETLIDSMIKQGFRVDEGYGKIVDNIRSALNIDKPITLSELRDSSLRSIVEIFVSSNGSGYSQVTYVYPEMDHPGGDVLTSIMKEMKEIDDSVQVVGMKVLGMELRKLIRKSVFVSSIIAFLAIVLILFLHFKKPYYVLLSVTPLIAGVIWGIGGMALFGLEFNIISISIVPVILGIGIDNGIHIVNRFVLEKENLRHIFHHTGRALIMTSLTTIAGFGSLVFADYPGLVGLGIVAIFGIGATLLSAIIFLPALLTAFYHRENI